MSRRRRAGKETSLGLTPDPSPRGRGELQERWKGIFTRPLSARQAEALGLFEEGLNRRQVRERMGLSDSRMGQHIKNILKKVVPECREGGLVVLWRELYLARVRRSR